MKELRWKPSKISRVHPGVSTKVLHFNSFSPALFKATYSKEIFQGRRGPAEKVFVFDRTSAVVCLQYMSETHFKHFYLQGNTQDRSITTPNNELIDQGQLSPSKHRSK